MSPHALRRSGFSLIEVLVVTSIIAALTGVLVPRVIRVIDRMNVSGAARHAAMVIVTARQAAIAHARHASVRIDVGNARISAFLGKDTIVTRRLGEQFGVTITATRDSMSYNAVGLGHGAANLSLVVRRGKAADTVVTSRVGRVRW